MRESILRYPAYFHFSLFRWRGWDWRFQIPVDRYFASRRKLRNPENREENYWRFVTPGEETLVNMVECIGHLYLGKGWREEQRSLAQLVVEFVHHIPYQEREYSYVKYPLETLCEQGGNCVDLSVLGASLLTIGGINSCFFIWRDHVALGIAVPVRGAYQEIEGRRYYFAEMTGNFQVRKLSWSGQGEAFQIRNLNCSSIGKASRSFHGVDVQLRR